MSTFKGKVNNSIRLLLLLMAALMISSYATAQTGYHANVMKGSIIEMQDSKIYICIGSKDGAETGQEFAVYRFVKEISPNPKLPMRFKKEEKGSVKSTEIVDEHYAKAKVLAGDVRVNDVVELTSATQEVGHRHH